MKTCVVIISLSCLVLLIATCNKPVKVNMKDLDQNMLDLGLYHDNLGIHLRKGEADYSLWLLEGMDSCLLVIGAGFAQHPKLQVPFEKEYRKRLRPSIKDMRKALHKNDMPAAINNYRLLTKKCNGCHVDHDVSKEVLDLSNPAYNDL
jgi:hypothetical protein